MSTRSDKVIYIDLESLIDMRQGFLVYKGIAYDRVREIVSSEEHNERESDTFSYVEGSTYREEVDKGNIELLKHGTVSYILSTLMFHVNDSIAIDRNGGGSGLGSIWVNIYPFKLNNDQKNMLRDIIFTRLKTDVYIEIIETPLEMLTPSFLRENCINVAFIYPFLRWLEIHMTGIMSTRLDNTRLLVPPLYLNEPTTEDHEIMAKTGFPVFFNYITASIRQFVRTTAQPLPLYTNTILAKDVFSNYNQFLKESLKTFQKDHPDVVEEAEFMANQQVDQLQGETDGKHGQ